MKVWSEKGKKRKKKKGILKHYLSIEVAVSGFSKFMYTFVALVDDKQCSTVFNKRKMSII